MTEPGAMTFLEHLHELRRRIFRMVMVTGVAFFVLYAFHVEVFDFISAPIQDGLIRHGIYHFRALKVTEPIMVYLKVSLVAALLLASPYVILELWFFISPGLLRHEKRFALPVLFFGSCFFLLGAAFCYRVMLPFLTDFLVGVGEESAGVAVDVTLESALGFALTFLLMFGVIFELPLVLFFMTLLEMVTPKKLIAFFRYWLVLAFLIGAMLTPPDPISQVMMAAPLMVLYVVGIGASAVAHVQVKRKVPGEPGRTAPAWALTGAVLLALLLAGFAWALRPRSEPTPLELAGDEAPVVMGVQPAVLREVGLWSSFRDDLSAALPALWPDIEGAAAGAEIMLLNTDLRQPPVVVLGGAGVHERLRERMEQVGSQPRREGAATVYGSESAMRAGAGGGIVGCYEKVCAAGPVSEVMARLRQQRALTLTPKADEVLERLRASGPAWLRARGAAVAALARPVSAPIAEHATELRAWLGLEGARVAGIEAVVLPPTDPLEAAVKVLRWPGADSASSAAAALPVGLPIARALAMLPRPPSPALGDLRAVPDLKPPDLPRLLAVSSHLAAEPPPEWPSSLSLLAAPGLHLSALKRREDAIEVTWRQGEASVRAGSDGAQ